MPQVQGVFKESAKKRFASYVRLRLGGDRAPSPEPPPRLSRGESPLLLRRNLVDHPSPSFPRRFDSIIVALFFFFLICLFGYKNFKN